MADRKDRRTNMINSSIQAPPAKDGAGGSFVWGSPTSVTDYVASGVNHVGLQVKKDAIDSIKIEPEAYVNDLDQFPELTPPVTRPVAESWTKKEAAESWRPLNDTERKGKMKAVMKEGGSVGIDLEGASHMGGTRFFCNYVVEPAGDLQLLTESVKAMNAPQKLKTRAHEARAGCSADVAKMITTANPCQIQVAAYVPKELQGSLGPLEWLQDVMDWYGGEVVQKGEELCFGTIDNLNGYGMGYEILCRHHATDMLQAKGLMAKDSHHHDDEVFGDDHFPGMSEERKKSIFEKRKSMTPLH